VEVSFIDGGNQSTEYEKNHILTKGHEFEKLFLKFVDRTLGKKFEDNFIANK
jgi:hypothetical protein